MTGRVNSVDDPRQLVVFELADETYGVDIYQVREIIRVPEVTRIPRTPDFVEGVINLRGGVIPVLDLRQRFGLPPRDASNDARIVIVELGDQRVGMRVDRVSEVLRAEGGQIEPPSPYIAGSDTRFVTGIARLGDALVILLDLNLILLKEEIEQISDVAETAAQSVPS